MNEKEFLLQQQAAVEKMRETSARARFKSGNQNQSAVHHNSPPQNTAPNTAFNLSAAKNQDFPVLEWLKNGDTALILGLLLLLFSENADKRLLFALIYILL